MLYDFETLVDRSRAGSVKWDAMRKKDPAVPAGVVPLSVGDMELRSPPELVEGLKRYLDDNVLGYTAPTPEYFRATADWFEKRHAWKIDPEWIVTVDGVVPALYLAVAAFSKPEDGVVFMPPVYRPLYHAIANQARRPVAVPLLAGPDGYGIDFAGLEAALAESGAKLLLFCSPHNPVSRVWRQDELERLGRICLAHDVLVVSDEIHMDFVMPGHRHLVFSEAAPGLADRSIICTAPSKTFNLAGLQTSNIVIPNPDARRRFRDIYFAGGRHGVNQLGLAACRIAYEHCGGWLDAVLGLIRGNGDMVRSFMAEHFPEIPVHPHEGTYFIWLDFRKWNLDNAALEQFMINKARLFLDEGYVFGEEGSGFERINLACPAWVLREALERLLAAGKAR